MIDVNYIKNILTTDDIISVCSELGADFKQSNNGQTIFYSICHHRSDPMNHKPKLYYYDNTKSFYCFSCGFSGDIFALVEKIKGIDFRSALEYVCRICRIEQTVVKKPQCRDEWEKELKKFLPNYEASEPIKIYDDVVLNLFKPYYHKSWLDDGISKAAMDKFNIGWYERNAMITIPVYDIDGKLIGIHGRNTRRALIDKGLKYMPVKTLNSEYKFPTSGTLYGLYENKENIKNRKSVIIVEAPKSVLQAESILDSNNTVALFGWNCQARRRDILLDLGVTDVTIALDRQYHAPSGDEFNIYVKQVKKIANLFKPYCDVYVIWDKKNRLGYKDSPFDCGKDIFNELYNERMKI